MAGNVRHVRSPFYGVGACKLCLPNENKVEILKVVSFEAHETSF